MRLEGAKELDAALAELTRAAARGVLRRTAEAALEPTAKAARDMAPVQFGDLRDGITVSDRTSEGKSNPGKMAFGAVLRAGGSRQEARAALINANRAGKSGLLSVTLHAGPGRHPQAITQEFGTSFHPPQAYMRPAWDATKGAALAIIRQTLGREVDMAAARAARKAMRAAAKAGAN